MSRRWIIWLLVIGAVLVFGAALSPWIVQAYWRAKSSNPVRRGIQRATQLGCFHCHGPRGTEGIPDPAKPEGVPPWSGGVWMMYVENEDEIRDFILNGHGDEGITMPAYRDVLGGTDLEDLVAAFKVLARMNSPAKDTPARRGVELAKRWSCFSCHGVNGSGGLPNPGSFAGFVPGWYGADFDDLVRSREEFDTWIVEGSIPRLRDAAIASFFVDRQRVSMPAYEALEPDELDDLWAYVEWLRETDGGREGAQRTW